MTPRQIAEKIVERGSATLNIKLNIEGEGSIHMLDIVTAHKQSLINAFEQALVDHGTSERLSGRNEVLAEFKFYGTSSCETCDHGRITLFYKTPSCVECTNRFALKTMEDGK